MNLTDTFGVLKLASFIVIFSLLLFNRYIWSIETLVFLLSNFHQLQFNRYIWSIETIYKYLLVVFEKYLTDTFGVLKLKSLICSSMSFNHLTDTFGVLKQIGIKVVVLSSVDLTDTFGVLKHSPNNLLLLFALI